ncbi:MAG TPA: hypothetical protein DEB33_05970 [Gemmatimonadetes bacterium]|nr:hypothetical protein [Gemmatimonadota bacterium]|tara:strand:- start:1552 stop:3030 length:1479 start_codon:yes stop_codon:yes gene_type:complete
MITISKKFSWLSVCFLLACDAEVSQPEVGEEPGEPVDLSSYFITPTLCGDSEGPTCTSLRLGDAYLTTTSPAQGKLFACVAGNAGAPGSNPARITWIDWAAGTWNLLAKPFLPSGSFSPQSGSVSVSEDGGIRSITVNNLPVDGRIGDWPMTQYAALSAIDGNPGVPAATNVTFNIPIAPVVSVTPSCTSLGAIGVTLNGVVLYNAVDARGNDAVAHEIVDEFGGHPAMSAYHYHFLPERLDSAPMSDGHSGLVGYIRDGFGLYGYDGEGGVELTNADLDECHGHDHSPLGYHYHATIEYPYTIGCYRGDPESASFSSVRTVDDKAGGISYEVKTEPVRAFLKGMIAHHQQALDMVALVPRSTYGRDIREVAVRMHITQSEEIKLMQYWLNGDVIPDDDVGVVSGDQDRLMPGMLSEERMAKLRTAQGDDFDRLFLQSMIEHHKGAIEMVHVFLERFGSLGETIVVDWFIDHIKAEQGIEVARMSRMLARLP